MKRHNVWVILTQSQCVDLPAAVNASTHDLDGIHLASLFVAALPINKIMRDGDKNQGHNHANCTK